VAGEEGYMRLLRLFLDIRSTFMFADMTYMPVDMELLEMILDADQGDKEEYEAEFYDCDDFAYRLMGILHCDRIAAAWPVYNTWVVIPEGGHAILSFYYQCQVYGIEPQTDEIFLIPAGWTLIKMDG